MGGIRAALLLFAVFAFGQMNTGEIAGSVQDPSGAVLPGASIVVAQAETGQKFTGISNSAGEYLFAQLPVGVYSVTASAQNFKQSVLQRLEIHAGDRLRHDFMLELGDEREILTIQADVGNVQLESAEIRDVVGQQQMANLPLKGRQFLDLAMLSEGVVRPPGGTRGDAMQQAGNLVNVLGQRSGHNLYLLDGVTVTDEHFNNMVIAPSIDSTQEFNIQKTSYAPEFGGKSGAVINVISRSGSNDFHGSLFEFVRNDIFDAKNFFDSAAAPIPPFRQNQFGGTLGGPVVKNKTFFFLSYEGQRTRKSLTRRFPFLRRDAHRKFLGSAHDLRSSRRRRRAAPSVRGQPDPSDGAWTPCRRRCSLRYLCPICLASRRICSPRKTSGSIRTNTARRLDHQFTETRHDLSPRRRCSTRASSIHLDREFCKRACSPDSAAT